MKRFLAPIVIMLAATTGISHAAMVDLTTFSFDDRGGVDDTLSPNLATLTGDVGFFNEGVSNLLSFEYQLFYSDAASNAYATAIYISGPNFPPGGDLHFDRFAEAVSGSTGSTGWQTFYFPEPVSGTFFINLGDGDGATSLLIRNLQDNLPAVSPVPEPDTYALLLAGMGVMGALARRNRKPRHAPVR